MPVSVRKKDPLTAYRFRVVIEGYNPIGFTEVSGLSFGESTVINYREGPDEDTVRKQPGLTSYEDIVCKRGLDPDGTLYSIRESIYVPGGPNYGGGSADPLYRFNGFVYILEKDRTIAKVYKFIRGWARLYGNDPLNSTNEDVLVETLEIVHEGLTKVQG